MNVATDEVRAGNVRYGDHSAAPVGLTNPLTAPLFAPNEETEMSKWTGKPQLAAAERAYVDAEFDRLRLICERNRMEKTEYQRQLSAAWLRSVDALETLTALRGAHVAARLYQASEEEELV